MRIATTYARTGMFPDRVYASIRARALRPREHELADEPIHPYTLPVRRMPLRRTTRAGDIPARDG